VSLPTQDLPAAKIAAAVKSGAVSAREVVAAALARIEARNRALGAFTDVTAARALAKADAIDAARAKGATLGALAGAPFAAKNLFDIAGLPTRAGAPRSTVTCRPPKPTRRSLRGWRPRARSWSAG
jgi:Asp-tRNA(Asn)/Glu-tRNA(Gln) amidotransferase A subunit family amidase